MNHILATIFLFAFLMPQHVEQLKTIETKSTFITTDALQNVYTIEGNSVFQYNSTGDKLKEFNERKFGKPILVDASNALNILILYPNYATIIITDRNLAPLQTISFKEEGYSPLRMAALGSNNTVWLFDSKEMKLKQYDFTKKLLQSTEDLSLVFGKPITPNFLYCTESNIYLNDSHEGIFVFDLYGNYLKEFFIKGARSFQIINNQMLYVKKQQLRAFDLKSFNDMQITLPDSSTVKQARVEKDRLYILRKNELTLHRF